MLRLASSVSIQACGACGTMVVANLLRRDAPLQLILCMVLLASHDKALHAEELDLIVAVQPYKPNYSTTISSTCFLEGSPVPPHLQRQRCGRHLSARGTWAAKSIVSKGDLGKRLQVLEDFRRSILGWVTIYSLSRLALPQSAQVPHLRMEVSVALRWSLKTTL